MTGTGLVRDVRRLTSVPAPWVLLTLALGVSASATVGLATVGSAPSSAAALSALPAACGVIGAVTVGADFRFGCVHSELLAVGGRLAYVAGTTRAVALFTGATGALSAVVALLVAGLPTAPGTGLDTPQRLLLAAVAVAVTWGVLGAAVALLAGSQTSAVGVLLGYLVLAEPLLEATSSAAGQLLPGAVSATVLASQGWASVGGGALRLVLLCVLALAVAAAAMFRRAVPVTSS